MRLWFKDITIRPMAQHGTLFIARDLNERVLAPFQKEGGY
jgi:hypothetical protein